MEDKFMKVTNRTFAVIFTAMFITTLCGIIFKQAWWHIYTLIATGILAVVFWAEKEEPENETEDETNDKSPL